MMSEDLVTIKDVIKVKKDLIDIIEIEVAFLRAKDLESVGLLQSRENELIRALNLQSELFRIGDSVDVNYSKEDLQELEGLSEKFGALLKEKKKELDKAFLMQEKIQSIIRKAAKNVMSKPFYNDLGSRVISGSASLPMIVNKQI